MTHILTFKQVYLTCKETQSEVLQGGFGFTLNRKSKEGEKSQTKNRRRKFLLLYSFSRFYLRDILPLRKGYISVAVNIVGCTDVTLFRLEKVLNLFCPAPNVHVLEPFRLWRTLTGCATLPSHNQ